MSDISINEWHAINEMLQYSIETIEAFNNNFSLVGMRFLYLLTKLEQIAPEQTYQIYISQYFSVFGSSVSDNSGIYQSLKRFVNKVQELNVFDEICYVTNGKSSFIKVKPNPQYIDVLINLQNLLNKVDIELIKEIKSAYSLRIFFIINYVYLKNTTDHTRFKISYSMLRRICGLNDEEYRISSNFWTVLKVCVKELKTINLNGSKLHFEIKGAAEAKIVFVSIN